MPPSIKKDLIWCALYTQLQTWGSSWRLCLLLRQTFAQSFTKKGEKILPMYTCGPSYQKKGVIEILEHFTLPSSKKNGIQSWYVFIFTMCPLWIQNLKIPFKNLQFSLIICPLPVKIEEGRGGYSLHRVLTIIICPQFVFWTFRCGLVNGYQTFFVAS